ncbi:hypothetical protein GGR54DRAFT_27114 [Hypoxylon sp. NC1633]|nr:hypothetical protein GGR54DRAFT_27114 [Hypoxylon sp. NC1633]
MYIPHILDPRTPKGGIGKGFKGGSYGAGASHVGGGNNALPLWAKLVIAFGTVWLCIYLAFFVYFARKAHTQSKTPPNSDSPRSRSCANLVLRPAWKAFKYATLIQAVIWAVRKARDTVTTTKTTTKKVGGTFYRMVDEEEEKGVMKRGKGSANGSESGSGSGSEPAGEKLSPAHVAGYDQVGYEPPVSPAPYAAPGGH